MTWCRLRLRMSSLSWRIGMRWRWRCKHGRWRASRRRHPWIRLRDVWDWIIDWMLSNCDWMRQINELVDRELRIDVMKRSKEFSKSLCLSQPTLQHLISSPTLRRHGEHFNSSISSLQINNLTISTRSVNSIPPSPFSLPLAVRLSSFGKEDYSRAHFPSQITSRWN